MPRNRFKKKIKVLFLSKLNLGLPRIVAVLHVCFDKMMKQVYLVWQSRNYAVWEMYKQID